MAYVVEVNRRVAPLQHVADTAAGADPDIAGLWRRVVDQRMRGQPAVAGLLAARAGLVPGLTTRRAADIIWTMTDGRLYQSFVVDQRWSQASFEKWLFNTLCSSVLIHKRGPIDASAAFESGA